VLRSTLRPAGAQNSSYVKRFPITVAAIA